MLIPVELSKIIIDENRQDQVIVLKEKDGKRTFPITIGFVEASSIQMTISGVEPPRPMTHDLIVTLLTYLDADFERLIIDDLIGQTFHAKMQLRSREGEDMLIDVRPSDGIAVAVRCDTPVFVEEEILSRATMLEF